MALEDPLAPPGVMPPAPTIDATQQSPWSWIPQTWRPQIAGNPDVQNPDATPPTPQEQIARAVGAPVAPPLVPGGAPVLAPEREETPAPKAKPPEPALEPDAISGPGGLPPPGATSPDARPRLPWEYAGADRAQGDDANARELAQLDPQQYAMLEAKRQVTQQQETASRLLDESRRNAERAQREWDVYQTAQAATQRQIDETMAESKALAAQTTNPDRWKDTRSTGQAIAALGAVIAGGLQAPYYGGKNFGLDQINRSIDQDIDAQKTDMENRRGLLGARQNMLAQQFARTGDMYRAQETVRLALHQQAIDQIGLEMQNYDPRGSIAFAMAGAKKQLEAQQAQALQAFGDQQLKNNLERANTEKALAEAAKLRGETGGAGGAGGASNPNYTVASGYFNPFTNTPIMGRRPLGGKGEDPEERKAINAQVVAYYNLQNTWAELANFADKARQQRNLAGQIWHGFDDTTTKEFDGLRKAAAVYLAQSMGDKLSVSQIDAQESRVPELNTLISSRDVEGIIRHAQERSDRDFAGRMKVSGLDGEPVIAGAQSMRAAAPQPRPDAARAAAHEALATASMPGATPAAKKDALAATKAEQEREAAAVQRKADASDAMSAIQSGKLATVEPIAEWGPPSVIAGVRSLNSATDTYNRALENYHKVAASAPKRTGAKGDDAAASDKHTAELEDAALKVVGAKGAIDATSKQIAPLLDTSSNDDLVKWNRAHRGHELDTKFRMPGEK